MPVFSSVKGNGAMRSRILAKIVTTVLIASCQPSEPDVSYTPQFEVVEAPGDFPVTVPSSFESTLGWLVVPEDRADTTSKLVRLPVAIVHSKAEKKKSPVIYLAGGPGTAAMNIAAYPGAYPWLSNRDLIVIGQRGTHYAEPALMCPEYKEAVVTGSNKIDAVQACRSRLVASDIDLTSYHTKASADDLEDLRVSLGIERWTLYGGSYGTRLALIYAKHFGEHIEAMVLDSPLPPNAIYDDESAGNLDAALRAVARDCAQQPACQSEFPDLEERFFALLDKVSETPLRIDGLDRSIAAPDLVSLIPMTSGRGVINAPLLMDGVARLDPEILSGLSESPQVSHFAWGMRFSVWCAEAFPFSQRRLLNAPPDVLGGYESAAIDPKICDAWDVPEVDRSFIDPVVSDVPTLIIAGEFDPLTPPIWGELAAATLSNSMVVTVRGESHSPTQQWGGDGCAMELAAAFIDNPDMLLSAPKTEFCVFSRSAPSYRLSVED